MIGFGGSTASVPHLNPEIRELFQVEFPVFVEVEPLELRLHKTHELLLGHLAALVRVHEEQQLLGLPFSSGHFSIVWTWSRFLARFLSPHGSANHRAHAKNPRSDQDRRQ